MNLLVKFLILVEVGMSGNFFKFKAQKRRAEFNIIRHSIFTIWIKDELYLCYLIKSNVIRQFARAIIDLMVTSFLELFQLKFTVAQFVQQDLQNLRIAVFFSNAAAAEAAGFRPCLRCRPEQAPGNTRNTTITKITQKAMEWIEEGFLNEAKVKDLAKKLEVTDRYLRRIFQRELGVSPIEFAQTQRLLLSKCLLTDTLLSITEIAFAAGFNSLRRFNVLFKNRYGVNPTSFRRIIIKQEPVDSLVFYLSYQPPLEWQFLLTFLKERAIPRIEEIHKGAYKRIVRLEQKGQCLCWMDKS
jgi:methylphosphotriester-DNA--protein-cysteine methyltransferase